MSELKLHDYDPVKHMKHLWQWFTDRRMDYKLLDELPKIGSIVFYKELGVAAAFLRKLEPYYGVLDGLITNPEALPHLRSEAIDMCVESIIKKSCLAHLRHLMATTSIDSVLKRSEKFGFIKIPHTSIILHLEGA